MSAESTVNQIIDGSRSVADSASQAAIGFAQDAQTAAQHILTLGSVPSPDRPSLTIPAFDPTTDLTGDFLRAYNDAVADFDPAFQDQIEDFVDTYFPNLAACLQTSIDNWICNTITNGGTGMNADVEAAIWNRSREREILDSRRAEDEAVSGYASRGWSLPGGVLVDALQRVQQALSDKNSGHSRDVMIKQAEIEIENIRFAIGEGVKLRLGAISALVEFLRAWASMKELAIEKAKALVDAKTRLYQSVGAYYQALIGAASLVLEYDKIRVDSGLRQQEIIARNADAGVQARVNAAVSAAQAMGEMAAAALGSLNTLAEVSHNTSASES